MSDYKVKWGKVARTIIYEDSQGEFLFTTDVSPISGPEEGKHTLALERDTSYSSRIDAIKDEQLRMTEKKRLELIFERVKQYIISCGYQVKVWPDEFKGEK